MFGLSTTCIIGANNVNAKRNAVLTTACHVSERALSEYRNKVVEVIGEEKEKLILKSKEDLQVFLEEHPLFSKAKYEDGRYYNVTAEKQQLTSKLLMYNGYATIGKEYKLMWNDTGEVCEEWTFQELFALSCEIDIYVTQLVEYQRKKEVELKDCNTVDELYKVVIDYETMK